MQKKHKINFRLCSLLHPFHVPRLRTVHYNLMAATLFCARNDAKETECFTVQENEAAVAARRILRARAKAIAICLSDCLASSLSLSLPFTPSLDRSKIRTACVPLPPSPSSTLFHPLLLSPQLLLLQLCRRSRDRNRRFVFERVVLSSDFS